MIIHPSPDRPPGMAAMGTSFVGPSLDPIEGLTTTTWTSRDRKCWDQWRTDQWGIYNLLTNGGWIGVTSPTDPFNIDPKLPTLDVQVVGINGEKPQKILHRLQVVTCLWILESETPMNATSSFWEFHSLGLVYKGWAVWRSKQLFFFQESIGQPKRKDATSDAKMLTKSFRIHPNVSES